MGVKVWKKLFQKIKESGLFVKNCKEHPVLNLLEKLQPNLFKNELFSKVFLWILLASA